MAHTDTELMHDDAVQSLLNFVHTNAVLAPWLSDTGLTKENDPDAERISSSVP